MFLFYILCCVYSEKCSREKVRVDNIDANALMKVCLQCAREYKARRKYGIQAYEADEVEVEDETIDTTNSSTKS